jgi:hypothetical protein
MISGLIVVLFGVSVRFPAFLGHPVRGSPSPTPGTGGHCPVCGLGTTSQAPWVMPYWLSDNVVTPASQIAPYIGLAKTYLRTALLDRWSRPTRVFLKLLTNQRWRSLTRRWPRLTAHNYVEKPHWGIVDKLPGNSIRD